MRNKIIFFLLVLTIFLPKFILADAPPPPPFDVNLTYEGQKISDAKFYAVALQCQQEKNSEIVVIPQLDINQPDPAKSCSWSPRRSAEGGFCADSACHFDWVYGQFKLAFYIPSLDKTFISETINREYLGHYGSETQRVYDVNLLKDNSVIVSDVVPPQSFTDDVIGGLFLWGIIATIVLESIVALIFVLLKKAPKRIFLALLVGNIISVPFVWIVSAVGYSFPGILFITEIIAVVFEAWIIKLFVKNRLTWKMCLLISLIMNVVSFIIGLCLLRLIG